MSTSLYYPLLVVGLAYACLSIAAGSVARRGDADKGERYRDLAFGTVLAGAAYTVVMLLLAAIDTPNRFTDALLIIAEIFVFFALLLFLLSLVTQGLSRLRRRPER